MSRRAQKLILATACLVALAGAAFADRYPISGSWGISKWTDKGAIDCANLRVITFSGEERTDSKGGVPGYRNNWIRREDGGRYRVSDSFSNGQVHNGQVFYQLRALDPDRLEMILDRGGTLRLQRCQ
jgi:hypothetical protein